MVYFLDWRGSRLKVDCSFFIVPLVSSISGIIGTSSIWVIVAIAVLVC